MQKLAILPVSPIFVLLEVYKGITLIFIAFVVKLFSLIPTVLFFYRVTNRGEKKTNLKFWAWNWKLAFVKSEALTVSLFKIRSIHWSNHSNMSLFHQITRSDYEDDEKEIRSSRFKTRRETLKELRKREIDRILWLEFSRKKKDITVEEKRKNEKRTFMSQRK